MPHLYDSSVSADRAIKQQLLINDFGYQLLRKNLEKLLLREDPNLLQRAEEVAHYAWAAHPGRFTDGVVENILLEAGRSLKNVPPSPLVLNLVGGKTRTLHVASELYLTGGHSRVLAKWVQRDLGSSHDIVVTRQSGLIPEYLTAIADDRSAKITLLNPSDSILQRAQILRSISSVYDRVILHHHPDDAVPVLAYATPAGCPVAMFNHAHFSYSLGSSVADVIINTMPYFRELTERYRFPWKCAILEGPLGLDRLYWQKVDKYQAKESLGISGDSLVAMTIGAEAYFTPSRGINFFDTLGKILKIKPDLHVLIVGVAADSVLVPSDIRNSRRVTLVGPVADPRPYYEASDICLESFPMPSLGALTEAVAYGEAFPVPAFAEVENPLRVNQQRVSSIAVRQRTEADYIAYIIDLLENQTKTREKAATLRHMLIRDDECFGDQFSELYKLIDRAGHKPRQIPVTDCALTPENIVLASRANPAALRDAIAKLPAIDSVGSYVRAAALGYVPIGKAVSYLARDLARPLARRLGFRKNP